MSTNGFEDKGSYPYEVPPDKAYPHSDSAPPGKVIPIKKIPGGYVTQRYTEAEKREFMVGLVVAAIVLVVGFSFGYAVGAIYG